ncbi:hypothetical protein C4D60_Mb00t02040 [Musa balbisiana]|uniref:Uncharacterized protein n=1 Tax=Musa balbisiana TaxID=52838 RepID=A0A4S8I636_MUSBA|nr:hypothetical protein C4D60_Mb00t00970 [Musa balbisiana]THU43494.1 hypothetical protein C4D60_Mb00t02040 [Musa balbisiana]
MGVFRKNWLFQLDSYSRTRGKKHFYYRRVPITFDQRTVRLQSVGKALDLGKNGRRSNLSSEDAVLISERLVSEDINKDLNTQIYSIQNSCYKPRTRKNH